MGLKDLWKVWKERETRKEKKARLENERIAKKLYEERIRKENHEKYLKESEKRIKKRKYDKHLKELKELKEKQQAEAKEREIAKIYKNCKNCRSYRSGECFGGENGEICEFFSQVPPLDDEVRLDWLSDSD